MSRGVLYVGTTREYVEEAKKSIETVRQENGGLSTAILTSERLMEEGLSSECFDHVLVAETPELGEGIYPRCFNLNKTPFNRTLCLDTDTHVLGDISDLFDILNEFDVAIPHNESRRVVEVPHIPKCFPEPNDGVFCFEKSTRFDDFLEEWQRLYLRQLQEGNPHTSMEHTADGRKYDQTPLREALYFSDLRIATLPSEYHFRGLSVYAEDEVKIIHMRNDDVPKLAETINQRLAPRVYHTQQKRLTYYDGEEVYFGSRLVDEIVTKPAFKQMLRRLGLYPTAKQLYDAYFRS